VSFAAGHDSRNDESLPVDFEAYADLLADTASAVRAGGKSGPVPERSRRTLEGLGIRSERWLETIRNYRRRFFAMVGTVHRIAVCCARTDRCQAKGSVWADRAFRNCG
jgi:hypothetical protein